MNKFLSLILVVLACSCCTPREKVFYISSTTGSDSNPGTKKAPLRTFGALSAGQKTGAMILFKAGDIFFESISGCTDCTVSSYGEGRKPIICGFRVQKDPGSWTDEGDGIWRLDMAREEDFYGYTHETVEKVHYSGNIGCLWSPEDNRITGNLVFSKDLLEKEGDFFVSGQWKPEETTAGDFRYLYMKSATRPRAYCLASGNDGVYDMTRCNISSIAVVGFGAHGMRDCRECIISDCDIDIIGGSLLIGFSHDYAVRYGNGVEFWIGDDPFNGTTVRNCQISRCYDTATTIQGPTTLELHSKGNHFINNRIAYCQQAFEHWATTDGHPAIYEDCCFNDNVIFCCGDNRFEGTPHRDNDVALLLCGNSPEEYLEIKGNLIYGRNYRYGCTSGVGGGEVYVVAGSKLVFGTATAITALGPRDIDSYRNIYGDDSDITIVQPDSPEDLAARARVSDAVNLDYPVPSAEELSRYD
ncbi:MAG: hypothetical protein IJK96_07530 [Bacteroidales bacterium]|nr:hypothetical protein [Bacteroidales bacterium]